MLIRISDIIISEQKIIQVWTATEISRLGDFSAAWETQWLRSPKASPLMQYVRATERESEVKGGVYQLASHTSPLQAGPHTVAYARRRPGAPQLVRRPGALKDRSSSDKVWPR